MQLPWFRSILGRSDPLGGGHEPVHHEPPPLPSERSTGLVFAAAALVLAVLLSHAPALSAAAIAGATVFAVLAVLAPGRLAPLNRAWFQLALALNRVMSPLIMLVLFAVVIVPAGLLMQLRRDPLGKHRDSAAPTYWRQRPASAGGTMRDQF